MPPHNPPQGCSEQEGRGLHDESKTNSNRYKKILLGRKGSKIKDIRIKSQKEISNILDVKTHLYINIISSDAKKI